MSCECITCNVLFTSITRAHFVPAPYSAYLQRPYLHSQRFPAFSCWLRYLIGHSFLRKQQCLILSLRGIFSLHRWLRCSFTFLRWCLGVCVCVIVSEPIFYLLSNDKSMCVQCTQSTQITIIMLRSTIHTHCEFAEMKRHTKSSHNRIRSETDGVRREMAVSYADVHRTTMVRWSIWNLSSRTKQTTSGSDIERQ